MVLCADFNTNPEKSSKKDDRETARGHGSGDHGEVPRPYQSWYHVLIATPVLGHRKVDGGETTRGHGSGDHGQVPCPLMSATPIMVPCADFNSKPGNHPRWKVAKQPQAMGLVIMGRCLAAASCLGVSAVFVCPRKMIKEFLASWTHRSPLR